MKNYIIIRQLGIQIYQKTIKKMKDFSYKRKICEKVDEIWFVQHPKIFTYSSKENKTNFKITNCNIPKCQTNRGGKTTYHGIGQQVIYFMINLKQYHMQIKQFIKKIENIIINTLKYFSINSYTRKKYPGIYVQKEKISSIGLNIYHGYSSHGLSLNISMDLSPFKTIYPCGIKGLNMTQINNYAKGINITDVLPILIQECKKNFSIKKIFFKNFF